MKLALCMIVRDEEEFIEQCINSVKSIVDEIIIVDNGSKDRTKEIAKGLGAKIIDNEWKDDFSQARNVYLKHVKSDWILVLDADEKIAEKDLKKIKSLLKEEFIGYLLPTRNYLNDSSVSSFKYSKDDVYEESKPYKGWAEHGMVRLFRRKEGIEYKGKVHESIKQSIIDKGGKIIITGIPIHHYGKLRDTVGKKSEAYEELGKEKAAEQGDFKSFFELGVQQLVRGKDHDAVKSLSKAIMLNKNDHRSYVNLGTAFIRLEDYDKAVETMKKGLEIKEHHDLYNNIGVAYERQGSIGMAFDSFSKSAYLKENVEAYSNIVRICFTLEKYDDAKRVLKRIIGMDPENTTAYNNLGGLYYRDAEYDKAITILSKSLDIAKHPFTFENLAFAYSMKNDNKKAKEYFQKALESGHPDPKNIKDEINKISGS